MFQRFLNNGISRCPFQGSIITKYFTSLRKRFIDFFQIPFQFFCQQLFCGKVRVLKNKTRTSEVSAIFGAQKAQRFENMLRKIFIKNSRKRVETSFVPFVLGKRFKKLDIARWDIKNVSCEPLSKRSSSDIAIKWDSAVVFELRPPF